MENTATKAFKKRTIKSEKIAEFFEHQIISLNYNFVKIGYEKRLFSPGFNKKIKFINDENCKKIRFTPDYFLYSEIFSGLVELKSSDFTIERQAHSYYLKWYNLMPVYIFFINRSGIWIQDLKTIKLVEQVGDFKFMSLQTKRGPWPIKIPVEDKIWICPKKLSKEDFDEYKTAKKSSGNSYAEMEEAGFVNIVPQKKLSQYKIDFDFLKNSL